MSLKALSFFRRTGVSNSSSTCTLTASSRAILTAAASRCCSNTRLASWSPETESAYTQGCVLMLRRWCLLVPWSMWQNNVSSGVSTSCTLIAIYSRNDTWNIASSTSVKPSLGLLLMLGWTAYLRLLLQVGIAYVLILHFKENKP